MQPSQLNLQQLYQFPLGPATTTTNASKSSAPIFTPSNDAEGNVTASSGTAAATNATQTKAKTPSQMLSQMDLNLD
uniref:Uncharacterized protein n=1 Tax=Globodera rostochiensis TaxID=31243 RepID=A0A914H8X0_GLORO